MRVAMIVVLALAAVVAVQAQSFERDVVDLNTWVPDNIPFNSDAGTGRPAVWEVQADGVEVRQDVNSEPSMFYDPNASSASSFTATVRVNSAGDDDFVGFALGFQAGDWTNPNADWILIDWKQNDQLDAPEGEGLAGLAVSRVQGAITDNTELYAHTGPVTEIARGATLNSTGWEDFTLHQFRITLTNNRLYVVVDGEVEFDLADDDSNMFPEEANIGFYVFSQQNTVFQLLESQQVETTQIDEELSYSITIEESDAINPYIVRATYEDGSTEDIDRVPNGDEQVYSAVFNRTFTEPGLQTVVVNIIINGVSIDEKPVLIDVEGEIVVPPPPTPDNCEVDTVSVAQLDANDGFAQIESDTNCACLQFTA